ncbi:MAG TPA: DUF4139 domain-containing protein, partial [Polyangiaceae bacterium LLY-WYZ-15_(1-7)]|nr:DUF4139 domain-containing protein [Polyangiaceae bacterium LLY-WYZ-15_(1-7)]
EALVLVPELEPVAVRRTRQTHEGEAPLLAGPVELVRDGGPAGRTKVLFVAPRERFELGWGPEPSVRVKRHAEAAKEESKLLSSWLTREHTVELKLSNLAAAPREVEVVERVPVSELKEVKVEVDAEATTDGARPDRDGFVRWTVELPPRGRRTLTLVYTVSRKSDVRGL